MMESIMPGEWFLSPWDILVVLFMVYVVAVLIFTLWGISMQWDHVAIRATEICIGGAC